jgi:hypothetical protein
MSARPVDSADGAEPEPVDERATEESASREVSQLVEAFAAGELSGGRPELLWRLAQVAYPQDADHPFVALSEAGLTDEEWGNVEQLAQGQPMVDPRSHVRGMSRGELELAARAGREPDRRVLERRVRACAFFAGDEEDFVGRLAADGLVVTCRVDPVDGVDVEGYMVALPADNGLQGRWYAASSLARDLTLPKLRAIWSEQWGLDVDDPRLRSVWSRSPELDWTGTEPGSERQTE